MKNSHSLRIQRLFIELIHPHLLRVRNTITLTCSVTTAASTSMLLLRVRHLNSPWPWLDLNCRQMHSTTLYRPYADRIPDTISHSSVFCCHATNPLLSISGEMRCFFGILYATAHCYCVTMEVLTPNTLQYLTEVYHNNNSKKE